MMRFMKKERARVCLIGVILFLSFGETVDAVIYEAASIGPKSSGMLGSVVATADDPIDSVFFNPATIGQVEGTNVCTGISIFRFPTEYRSPNGYKGTSNPEPLIPYLGYTTDRFSPIFLGAGVYSNFGAGSDFEKDPSRGVNGNLRSLIGTLSLNPTVAYQINPKLVVGIQGNITYGWAEIDFPLATEGVETESDGLGFGASLGVLYKPLTQLSIGLKWRSPSKFNLRGDAEFADNKDDLKLYLYYPQSVTIGFGYMPTNRLTLELDYTWYDWSHFHNSRFSYDTWSFLDGPVSGGMKDCFRLGVGIEYLLRNNTVLRAGYLYNKAATREEWISPLGPDITNQSISLGGAIELGNFEIGVSSVYTFIPVKRISPSESRSGFPGKYTGKMFVIATGITYQF